MGKTLSVSEDSLVDLLKTLPEKSLVNVFWKTLVISDVSVLSREEKKAIKSARKEFEDKETIEWENIK